MASGTTTLTGMLWRYGLAAALLGGAGYYIIESHHKLVAKVTLDVGVLLLALVALVVLIVLRAVAMRVLLVPLNVNLMAKEAWFLGTVSSFLNYALPMQAGTAFRAAYLKKFHGLHLLHFAGYLLVQSYLASWVTITAVAFAVAAAPLNDAQVELALLMVLATASAGGLVLFLAMQLDILPLTAAPTFLRYFRDGLRVIARDYTAVGRYLALHALTLVCQFVVFWLVLPGLGLDVGFIEGILFGTIFAANTIFYLTPGNLGLQEFSLAYIMTLVGHPFEVGLFVALVVRLLNFLAASLCAVTCVPTILSMRRTMRAGS